MLELQGKHNTAKVFADIIDNAAITQIILLCNQEFAKDSKIRIMPDVHAGAGCTIGTTMTVTDKAVPNLVGVDIGCGMEVVRVREKDISMAELDALIHEKIPSGFAIREEPHMYAGLAGLGELACVSHIDVDRAQKSIGTLGGGNHFIEADRDDDGNIWIVVHSGSRHLGLEVAEYYQERAYEQCNGTTKDDIQAMISRMKEEGRHKEINRVLESYRATKHTKIPKQLCYVSGEMFDDYIHDMGIVQKFADLNRRAMMDEITGGMGLTVEEQFTTVHNYIDVEAGILRKGAVSAKRGETLIIPMNMRDGSIICRGKGNADWNESAPHGAGRLMSRAEARAYFTLGEFREEMKGIYSTSVGRDTLDESPMAYKPMDAILSVIGDTVDIEKIIKPVYNFKAGGE